MDKNWDDCDGCLSRQGNCIRTYISHQKRKIENKCPCKLCLLKMRCIEGCITYVDYWNKVMVS